MREILEDSAIIYRQELDSLFALLVPGLIAGPLLLIIAAIGMKTALAVIPILLLFYIGLYAANLGWAGHQLTSSPLPAGPMLMGVVRRAPDIILSAGPVILLLLAVSACGLVVSDQGYSSLALLASAAGFIAVAHWLSRHAYELPLVVVYDASARQASDASLRLDDDARQWTSRLLLITGAPLIAVALISLWFAWALAPFAGIAVFLLALTMWMPFGALCLTAASSQLLGEGSARSSRPTRGHVSRPIP